MSQPRTPGITLVANRPGRILGALFVIFLMVVTALPGRPVLARHPTPPEAASPQPQETPTVTPTPTEEELKLQQEKKILELQRDIENAKKAIREAQPQPEKPPAPTATPLAGDTTLTEVKLEPEIVSYKAMSEAAKTLVFDIDTKFKTGTPLDNSISIKKLAVYDAQIVKDWRFYQALFPAFEGQVTDIKQQYQNILCPDNDTDSTFKANHCLVAFMPKNAVGKRAFSLISKSVLPGAFAAGTTLVKSFIDLTSLFRTETKIEGKSVTIDESALVAEVFRELKNQHPTELTLYYPEVFPPRVDPDEVSPTVTIIGELYLFKAEADRLIKIKEKLNDVDKETLEEPTDKQNKANQELGLLKRFKATLEKLETALSQEADAVTIKRLRSEIARTKTELSKIVPPKKLDERIKELDDLVKQLEKSMEPTKTLITSRETTIKALSDLNERFLKFVDQVIKPDNTGTNALTLFIKAEDIQNALGSEDSYWLEIKSVSAGGNNRTRKNLIWFFSGARVDHSGGVILEYTIYDRTGAVLWSDKLTHYEGYKEPKRIVTKKLTKETEFKDPIP
jgi:hypothetical protein